jgi:hypothetical protein
MRKELVPVRIQQVDASVLEKSKRAAPKRELSPKARARQRQQAQFSRMLKNLTDDSKVFEVRLGRAEKPLTVRQRLLKVAADTNTDVVVRKSERGWYVALATPERRSRRGRPAGTR